MENDGSLTQRAHAIRETIKTFLNGRLQEKLDKLRADDEDGRQKEAERFRPRIWLEDAARRSCQLQIVTHALKYSHPDARGTSLFYKPGADLPDTLVGTHSLPSPPPDVVGNAAALDVGKFLDLEAGGTTFLDMADARDPDFIAALDPDRDRALRWAETFAAVTGGRSGPASSTLARQVYFPLGNGEYHLLAPLFPTSLVHHVYGRINHDRFDEENRAAREARRKGEAYAHGFREYPGLTVLRFGGTKPQNISQLNSVRKGEAYLLPSLPPHWESAAVALPIHVSSVFPVSFGRREEVQDLTRKLRFFLETVQDYTNIRIRETRAGMIREIVDELLQYAACVQEFEPGWTRAVDCRLNEAEQLWLDPGRQEMDPDFRTKYADGAWRSEISERFARWLNRRIEGKHTPMGDPEFMEWKKEMEGML